MDNVYGFHPPVNDIQPRFSIYIVIGKRHLQNKERSETGKLRRKKAI